jgi:FkbH-like protein
VGNFSNQLSELTDIRAAYSDAIAANDVAAMLEHAQRLLNTNPSLAIAQKIVNTLPLELPGRPPLTRKVAILRSFTIETSIPFLKALAALHGIELMVRVGEFNSYSQEVIEPNSWLYDFDPDIIILAVQTRDLAPALWVGTLDSSVQASEDHLQESVSLFATLFKLLRSRCAASVIVQNLELPIQMSAGIMDLRKSVSQSEIIRSINRALSLEALKYEGIYILDYDALVSRHGRAHWTDEKKWLASRAPVSSQCLIYLAKEYLKFIVPLCGRGAKALVIDLDNTLWGGIIGEDGIDGIKIGSECPGAPYLELQRTILSIADRGILLAICSKNNQIDAMEVLENHPAMLLRSKHFAATRINWNDKAQNLREIAMELNVGLDSIAFLDDNPAERQRVKLAIPEIIIVELPEDPMGYAAALRASPVFECLAITVEDRDRAKYYSDQRGRRQLESSSASIEEFYRSLEMRAEIVQVNTLTLTRFARLTQKTNQLNTTTRRYSENEILGMLGNPAWNLFGVRIVDRFGDNGIVGAIFMKKVGATAEIDTFLLSCRVIGRTVETTMLAHACGIATRSNCRWLTGWFLPTRKNVPAAKIYSDHGFSLIDETENGAFWQLDLGERSIESPAWISSGTGG